MLESASTFSQAGSHVITRPRKLLIAADTMGGGMGALVTEHVRAARDTFEVHLAAPGASAFSEPGATTHEWPVPPKFIDAGLPESRRAIRALIDRLGDPVIHVHGIRSYFAIGPSRRPFVTLHGFGKQASDPRSRILVQRAALSLAAFTSRGAFSVMPLANKRWQFVPHASPRLREIDPVPVLGDGVTFIGSLDPPKRPEVVMRAAASAAWEGPVYIVGSTADRARLQHLQCTALEGSADVRLLGHTERPHEIFPSSRVVVLTSDFEGVPLVLQEAMWAGVPVIAPPLPGIRWLLGDQEGGLFATSTDEVASALQRVADIEFAQALGLAAAQRVRSLLHLGDPWERILSFY